MLETPLYGRFQGENRRLVFAPAAPYHALVRGCVVMGSLGALYGLAAQALGFPTPLYPQWWVLVGVLVAAAGVLGAMSLQSVVFDLKERTYRRRQGPGMFPTASSGRISDLDAIVLLAEPNVRMVQGGVTYHLVLHWKGMREPVLLLQQETRVLPAGQPINFGAAPLLQRGIEYARALGLPFYDNSHFPSACPVPVWSRR